MGFNEKHIGSKYIIEAIKFLYFNNINNFKLKNVFTYLSKKYNKSENTIKGNIRKAIEYIQNNYNKEFIINYFNYIELIKFPTASEIILTILEKM